MIIGSAGTDVHILDCVFLYVHWHAISCVFMRMCSEGAHLKLEEICSHYDLQVRCTHAHTHAHMH